MDERITIRYKSASAVLKVIEGSPEAYELTRVYSGKRHQGHGRGLMETVARFADNNGLFLSLTVRPYRAVADKIMNVSQLVEFYKKFGFLEMGSYHEPQMFRIHKTKADAENLMTDTTHHVPNTLIIRINNLDGKMIGYLDIDREHITSGTMLPTFKKELTELVRNRLGQEVVIEFIDRELEKFGLRQTPEGNLESV